MTHQPQPWVRVRVGGGLTHPTDVERLHPPTHMLPSRVCAPPPDPRYGSSVTLTAC